MFTTGSDPVKLGFVSSLNRPGGNVTGVSFLAAQLHAKRLELASQLATKDAPIAFLGRPREPRYAADRKEFEAAAAALGRNVLFFNVADERDFDAAFPAAARQHVGVLVLNADPFFNGHRNELIALAARYAVLAWSTATPWLGRPSSTNIGEAGAAAISGAAQCPEAF